MIVFTAKQINPKARIVARCHDMRNAEKMRKAGADTVVSPDFTGGMRIASAMIRPHVVSFLDEMLRSEHQLRVEEVDDSRQLRNPVLWANLSLQECQLHSAGRAHAAATGYSTRPPISFCSPATR